MATWLTAAAAVVLVGGGLYAGFRAGQPDPNAPIEIQLVKPPPGARTPSVEARSAEPTARPVTAAPDVDDLIRRATALRDTRPEVADRLEALLDDLAFEARRNPERIAEIAAELRALERRGE